MKRPVMSLCMLIVGRGRMEAARIVAHYSVGSWCSAVRTLGPDNKPPYSELLSESLLHDVGPGVIKSSLRAHLVPPRADISKVVETTGSGRDILGSFSFPGDFQPRLLFMGIVLSHHPLMRLGKALESRRSSPSRIWMDACFVCDEQVYVTSVNGGVCFQSGSEQENDKLVPGSLGLHRVFQTPGFETKDPRSAHDKARYPCQRAHGAPGRGLDELQALTS